MIANRYISTNMIDAMRNRRFEFDSLAFGLIIFSDIILFLLLLASLGSLDSDSPSIRLLSELS